MKEVAAKTWNVEGHCELAVYLVLDPKETTQSRSLLQYPFRERSF